MGTVYLLCLVVSNMIFNNEYRNQTMKNCVSYGISRRTIFFGKLAIQILYSLIAFAVIMGMFVASAFLLLENSGKFELTKLVRTCLASLPLLISGLATMNCFAFLIDGSSAAVTASAGVMFAFPIACNLLGMRFELFDKLKDVLPWNILNIADYDQAKDTTILYWDSQKGFINCWTIGIAITVMITLLGFLVFRKKEIK
jgi:ABC-type transport system involved in multi-copper enzyme maturation permease subunit